MTEKQREERIKEISLQLKRLTNELSILTGTANGSIRDIQTTPTFILDLVLEVFKSDARSKSRKDNVVIARLAATYLLARYTRLSYLDISKAQGGKEHSVVSYRLNEVKDIMQSNADFRDKIMECMMRIEVQL